MLQLIHLNQFKSPFDGFTYSLYILLLLIIIIIIIIYYYYYLFFFKYIYLFFPSYVGR